jgi:hypothetical protein
MAIAADGNMVTKPDTHIYIPCHARERDTMSMTTKNLGRKFFFVCSSRLTDTTQTSKGLILAVQDISLVCTTVIVLLAD